LWDSSAKQDKLNFYELNYTPRRASEAHDESTYSDLMYFENPTVIPDAFRNLKVPQQMIHPNDYRILQHLKLIPENFPISQVSYTTSLNGKNEYVVGYSLPMNFTLNSGETIRAVKPLWAVSFGNAFNTNSTPPQDLAADFNEVAQRLIVAEGLHARANEGCDYRLNHNLCAAEKNAILGILIERYKRRKERKPELNNLKFEDIIFKKQMWNPSKSFKAGYNGHPGSSTPAIHAQANQKIPISQFQDKWKNNYNYHKKYDLWHLPSYGRHATHYSHYDAQNGVPSFFATPDPVISSDEHDYAAKHNIRIGRTIVRDQRKGYA